MLHKYFGAGGQRGKGTGTNPGLCLLHLFLSLSRTGADRRRQRAKAEEERLEGLTKTLLTPRGRPAQGLRAGAGRSLRSILGEAASEHHGKILPPSDMAPTYLAAAAGSDTAARGSRRESGLAWGCGAERGRGGGARGSAC